MKRFLVLFTAVCAVFATAADEYDLSKAQLKGGAVYSDGVLKLDGKKAYVLLPGTEDFNISTDGLTLACAVKPVNERKTGDRAKDHDAYISKVQTPFTLCRSGFYTSMRIRTAANKFLPTLSSKSSKYAPAGRWSHLAAVFAYDGKNLTCKLYFNGQKFAERTYENVTPATNNRPLEIGRGFGHIFSFEGEIAEVNVAKRTMSDAEIADMVKNSKFIGK